MEKYLMPENRTTFLKNQMAEIPAVNGTNSAS
jgi:hypothetical protein